MIGRLLIILKNDFFTRTFIARKKKSIMSSVIKGTLDKYDYKINLYQTCQLILPMHFHFISFFVNSIIPRVSHRPLCCVFIDVDFEK